MKPVPISQAKIIHLTGIIRNLFFFDLDPLRNTNLKSGLANFISRYGSVASLHSKVKTPFKTGKSLLSVLTTFSGSSGFGWKRRTLFVYQALSLSSETHLIRATSS
jgi:hypothetical protein